MQHRQRGTGTFAAVRMTAAATSLAVVALAGSAGAASAAGQPASAFANPVSLVSAVPATGTPDIRDGAVLDLAEVGSRIIAGGTFTSAATSAKATAVTRQRLLAFDAATGTLDPGFAPLADGEVDAVAPGPSAGTVLVGGTFTHIDGAAMPHLALLDTVTGAPVAGFVPPVLNGPVDDIVVTHGHVLVAGGFTKAGAVGRRGLVSLDPATGAVDGYTKLAFTGHHNWTGLPGESKAWVGPTRLGVSPDGTHLVAIGNFTMVGTQSRDQVAMLLLGPTSLTVDATWATSLYVPPCMTYWDSYVRDVAFSPDGGYFVVVTTGGYGLNGERWACDAAARWDIGRTGSDVPPTWVAETGGDTLLSVAVTATSVYVGGHMRWMNNTTATWSALPGAVPRPGIAALDPLTGLPQAWNPGRNPRGVGTTALLVTENGLYVGSDTAYIGDRRYRRGRVAFFPYDGTSPAADAVAPTLPVRVCRLAAVGAPDAGAACRTFDGSTVGPQTTQAGAGWPAGRFAFTVGSTVYAAPGDGTLRARVVGPDGPGAQTVLDPYDDPAWATVKNGFPTGQTYRGMPATLLTDETSWVTAAFVDAGRLYYTLAGSPSLFWRAFGPDAGIVGAEEHVVAGGADAADLTGTTGAFVADGTLYRVDGAGSLHAADWAGGAPTASSDRVVSGPALDGVDWLGSGAPLVVLPGAGG